MLEHAFFGSVGVLNEYCKGEYVFVVTASKNSWRLFATDVGMEYRWYVLRNVGKLEQHRLTKYRPIQYS